MRSLDSEGSSIARGAGRDDCSDETARLVRSQATLLAFIESISAELELRPLLTRILRYACELIGADHGTIGLVDETRNVVRTEAIYNMPEDELGAEMAPGVGIAGHVLVTGEPIVLDRYGDVTQPSRFDSLENPVIGMPIAWHGRMIGFFGIGSHAQAAARAGREPARFTSRDLDRLAVFARHAAIAIENARRYQWEQQRTERLGLIARIGRIITGNLSLPDLLQGAVDAIHELLGYPNVAIALLDPAEPDVLVLNTVGGFYKKIVRGEYRIPVTEGLMGAAVRSREVVLVNDVATDPRHLPTPGAVGIKAELAVPIRLGDRVLGVLNVECSQPFGDEDSASLGIVADQLAVAIENSRLYERGQYLAAFEERQRLARDLHDSVTQHIFGMNLMAQSLGPAARRDPAEAERRITRLLELSGMAMSEMRALLSEMRPDAGRVDGMLTGIALVRRSGLVDALRAHVAGFTDSEPAVEVDARGYRRQAPDVEEALFRIAQEALANVVKHARAECVALRLTSEEAATRLLVRDDGIGFRPRDHDGDRPPARGASGGFGLSSMRERAEALGGSLEVRSSPRRGTVVEARIPRRSEGSA